MSPSRPPLPVVMHRIGRSEIDAYAELSGDYNPLHMDPAFAARTQFGTVIAHGPIGLQVLFESVSEWLETDGIPAGVTVDVRFRAPVRIGDEIVAEMGQIHEHAGRVVVSVTCVNQRRESVIEGLVSAPSVLAPRSS